MFSSTVLSLLQREDVAELAGGRREAEVMIEILEMELMSSRTSSSVRRQGYSGGECSFLRQISLEALQP